MNHRVWVSGIVLFGVAGCLSQPGSSRLQAEDESERDKEAVYAEVKTIGDVSSVSNAEPIHISGVGLVVDLEGTGGGAPPGGYRNMLEAQFKKKNLDNIKEILASPNHSMVLVSALIPAGARKGDPLDVEITLPPQSKTTSLRGGRLLECQLYNYDTAKHLDPGYGGPNELFKGHVLAHAEGPLLVGFGDGDQAAKLRQGRIWGGGRCLIDRPFFLALNTDQQYARVAMRMADRINETFQGPQRGAPGTEVASAKTKEVVVLGVPPQYRHNLPRYLRVVRLMPLQGMPVPASAYRRRLEEDLLDPAHTVVAALRLEALGTESVPVLKTGLNSKHVLVRFTAAEALAYLGSPSCGEELARLIEQQPALRAFCLTAMASLDENVCHIKLRDLLSAPSAEARYGAFRALRALEEHERDSCVRGELLNDSFWVHRVAPDSSPLVHISSSRRAEVVLFGEAPVLEPPFSIMAGAEFTITAGNDDDHCTISRFSMRHGSKRAQCSLKLEDVLRKMAELGATYPDVVELLNQADRCRSLTCRVGVDELPQATSVYELARAGAKDPDFLKTDEEIVQARSEFGATPNLFDRGISQRRRTRLDDADAEALQRDNKPKDDAKAKADRRHTTW